MLRNGANFNCYSCLSRFNFFSGCPNAKTCTIVLRGGAEQFLEETERSLHDAIMIVRRTIKNDAVVAGMQNLNSVFIDNKIFLVIV